MQANVQLVRALVPKPDHCGNGLWLARQVWARVWSTLWTLAAVTMLLLLRHNHAIPQKVVRGVLCCGHLYSTCSILFLPRRLAKRVQQRRCASIGTTVCWKGRRCQPLRLSYRWFPSPSSLQWQPTGICRQAHQFSNTKDSSQSRCWIGEVTPTCRSNKC